MTIPEESPNTGFIGNKDATASAAAFENRSMTEQEEHASW
jgi:hypothetical protein